MVRFRRIYLLYLLWYLCVTINLSGNADIKTRLRPKGMTYKRGNVKISRAMQRQYEQWTTSPNNNSRMLHSIPVEVTELEDGTLLMTSPYRETNNRILTARLLLEFSSASKPRDLLFNTYHADLTPLIGFHDTTTSEHRCSGKTVKSTPRYRDGHLEMRFKIKLMYTSCKKLNGTSIKFKFRLYGPNGQASDIKVKAGRDNVFILVIERFQLDNTNFLPKKAAKTLRHMRKLPEKSYRKVPQLRYFVSRRKKSTKPCQLKLWFLKFETIGWDWVIAPPSFYANRCSGRCSFPLTQNVKPSTHAVLQTLTNSICGTPSAASCVANELGPLTMMYVDEEVITVKTFPDVKVKSCACL